MNAQEFAALTRAIEEVVSRRRALWAIAGGLFTSLGGLRQPQEMEGAKRVSTGGGINGAACHADTECNGGLCQKNGKCLERTRHRRRHLTIIKRSGKCRCACKPGNSTCSQSLRRTCAFVDDAGSAERRGCYCRAGSATTICGDVALAACVACESDADCLAETGPGSVCVAVSGDCACQNGSPTTCVPPCRSS